MSVHEKVMGAVARGWCAPVNSRKEMDAALAALSSPPTEEGQ